MHPALRMRQYERQAVTSASPDQLIAKLYDLGVSACHRGDRAKVRAVLVELTGSLNLEEGGELASRLYSIYEFCLLQVAAGDLAPICDLLDGLREAWHGGVLATRAAA